MITIRLWSYQLIPFLPRQQLLSQWRECVCIAKSIHDKGTPNHILVNKIMDYPISEFIDYCNIVLREMNKRGYKVSVSSIQKLQDYVSYSVVSREERTYPFKDWHILRYLDQCMYNLEEKWDCGGVTNEEWGKLMWGYKQITGGDFKCHTL